MTFSANAGGPYARGWHKPPNRRTGPQNTARVGLGNLSVGWRGITAAQKVLWDAYAALPAQTLTDSLGQPYNVSGFNWYITTNTNRLILGLAVIATPPVLARLAAPIIQLVQFIIAFGSNPRVTITAADPTLAEKKVVRAVIVNSVGISAQPASLYQMFVGVPNGSRNMEFRAAALGKFGTFAIGQKIFVETYNISTEGQASASSFGSALAT